MANDATTHWGAVAGPRGGWPLGTRLRVFPRPVGVPAVVTVEDRIGWGSQLDFWVSSCAYAREWGRRTVRVQVLDG